jgi:hypothetical protein
MMAALVGAAFALGQREMMQEHLWMPMPDIYLATNEKLEGATPHMLDQNMFYRGLNPGLNPSL